MKFSSEILQPAEADGKIPTRLSGENLETASLRMLPSNKYFPLNE